jgi:hypothetical protein
MLYLGSIAARAASNLKIEVDTAKLTYRIIADIGSAPIWYDAGFLDENRGGRILIKNAKGETLPIFDPSGYSEYWRNQMVRSTMKAAETFKSQPRRITESGPITDWRPILDLMLTIKNSTSVPVSDWKGIKIVYSLSDGTKSVVAESDWFSLKQEVLAAIPSYR